MNVIIRIKNTLTVLILITTFNSAAVHASDDGFSTDDPTSLSVASLDCNGRSLVASYNEAAIPSDVSVTKNIKSHDEGIQVTVTIKNGTQESLFCENGLSLSFNKILDSSDSSGLGYGSSELNIIHPIWMNERKMISGAFSDIPKSNLKTFGLFNRYSVFLVTSKDVITVSADTDADFFILKTKAFEIGSGEILNFSYTVVAGSKSDISEYPAYSGIKYFGYWEVLQNFFHVVESILHQLLLMTGSWPVAIFCLALFFKILLIPINKKMDEIQRLVTENQNVMQPIIESIKENVEDGAHRSELILQAYKDKKISPFDSLKTSIPLLIQIPIFLSIFAIMNNDLLLKEVSWLWVGDLSLPDRLFSWGFDLPYFGSYFNLLPIIMTIVSILSAWSNKNLNKEQMKSLYVMNFMFLLLFYSFPASMVLYWTFSNLIQIIFSYTKKLR